MVSRHIVSKNDYYSAQVSYDVIWHHGCTHPHTQDCYKKLYTAGMNGSIRKAPHYYEYYHQKFWIVDNTTVHLSTGLCVCVRACVLACVCAWIVCMYVYVRVYVMLNNYSTSLNQFSHIIHRNGSLTIVWWHCQISGVTHDQVWTGGMTKCEAWLSNKYHTSKYCTILYIPIIHSFIVLLLL